MKMVVIAFSKDVRHSTMITSIIISRGHNQSSGPKTEAELAP